MKKNKKKNVEMKECIHKNLKQDSGFLVCQDCGLILEENIPFEETSSSDYYSDSQLEYERRIRVNDSKAIQDPVIKQKYDKIKTLDKWFKDYQSSFSEQKKTIELLKSYGIGLNIDTAKYQNIKDRYLKYNKYHRHTYQNMVIIFLAIVWMEIKDTTNIRIDEFIETSSELGHKVNKKMLNNAMLKVKRTENMIKKQPGNPKELEKQIKNKIKILFQKDLNSIPYEYIKSYIPKKSEYDRLRVNMLLLAAKALDKISYEQLQNLNYKAFTAGLIYYIGQSKLVENRKIFTQSLIENMSKFSSTTIRKKYHMLKVILGDPQKLNL